MSSRVGPDSVHVNRGRPEGPGTGTRRELLGRERTGEMTLSFSHPPCLVDVLQDDKSDPRAIVANSPQVTERGERGQWELHF